MVIKGHEKSPELTYIIISTVNSDEDKNVIGMRRGGTVRVEYKIVSITRRCNITCVAAFV